MTDAVGRAVPCARVMVVLNSSVATEPPSVERKLGTIKAYFLAGTQPLATLRSLSLPVNQMRPSWKRVSETIALAMPMPWPRKTPARPNLDMSAAISPTAWERVGPGGVKVKVSERESAGQGEREWRWRRGVRWGKRGGFTSMVVMLFCCMEEVCMITSRRESGLVTTT